MGLFLCKAVTEEQIDVVRVSSVCVNLKFLLSRGKEKFSDIEIGLINVPVVF